MNIAIVDDAAADRDTVKQYLLQFSAEKRASFHIDTFPNAVAFLEHYSGKYDVVFMDIQMPYLNGMDAAKKLRTLDGKCILIFLTAIAQYAIAGYSVAALDYILKPVTYPEFIMKFSRAFKRLQERENHYIILSTASGSKKLEPEELAYVEVSKHTAVYHTQTGDYSKYESLKGIEEKLAGYPFVKCNSCYLVNLAFVKEIKENTAVVAVNGSLHSLLISRNRKKGFSAAYKSYLNGRFPEGAP